MRLLSLGSGSRGNATVIEAGDTRVLLDCGFPARELERRMAERELRPDCLSAILVTHEHGDHVSGVGPVARRYGLPVWMTPGTHRRGRCGELPVLELFSSHAGGFAIGELGIQPVAVPHDAREPCQFIFTHAECRLGVLTDVGSITPHILESYDGVDALVLECNHDTRMLAEGPYPPSLQARVGGRLGHLNNRQAAEFLRRIDHARIGRLVAAHLSEKNNHPEKVLETLADVSGDLLERLSLFHQEQVGDWLEF